MTASVLQQLLASYFAIIYSWQLSSSENNSSIYLKYFTDLDFFFSNFFSCFFIFFDKCLFTLSVTQSVCCNLSSQPFCCLETPKHNTFDQFWKFKSHFEHFPRNTRLLSFEGPSNYLYLFKNYRQTFSWPGERPSSLKLLKCDLIQTLNTFWDLYLRIITAGKASLAYFN